MKQCPDKNARFMQLISEHDALIYKVCYMYAEGRQEFDDLRQEVYVNLWCGLDSFNGNSKISTWVYRVALNTCITTFRRERRHNEDVPLDDEAYSKEDSNAEHLSMLREMYRLIGGLDRLDKAIVLLWLDENSYDQISEITGVSRANVAIKLHRIKKRLAASANN